MARERLTIQGELSAAQEELRLLRETDATEEEITEQLDTVKGLAAELIGVVEANIQRLQSMPGYSVMYGNLVDNRETLRAERLLLRELRAIRDERSVYQGPEIEI